MTFCSAVFDIGTSSLKGALIDKNGKVYIQSRLFFPATVEAENWFISFENMFKQFSDFAFNGNIKISGICISGNGPSLIAVSGETNKLLLWNVPLLKKEQAENDADTQKLLKKTLNTRSIFLPRFEVFSLLFPEEFKNAETFFSGPEFLIYKLTKNCVTVLPEERYTCAYWTKEELKEFKIPLKKIPPFVKAGSLCGFYRSIPVFAGVPDFIAALIGTDTVYPGAACDRAGSSEGINICVKEIPPPEKLKGLRVLPSPVAPFWNLAFILSDSGIIFYEYIKKHGGSFLDFDSFMQAIIDERNNPKNGESTAAAGNLLVEKIANEVKAGMDLLENAAGFRPVYTMCGGQAKSTLWRKLKAEITCRKFKMPRLADAELLGDAAIAFTSLGEYGSVSEAASLISGSRYINKPFYLQTDI